MFIYIPILHVLHCRQGTERGCSIADTCPKDQSNRLGDLVLHEVLTLSIQYLI